MFILVLFLAIVLMVIIYLAVFRTTRVQNAQRGININPRRGKKLCGEQGRDELWQHEGHPVANIYLVTFGGYSGNEGISQSLIACLVPKELLYFVLSPDGRSMRIDNSLGQDIGYYPAGNPYFELIAQRLKRGETVNAWVYDWGWERRYCCELKIVVYDYEKSLAPLDCSQTACALE